MSLEDLSLGEFIPALSPEYTNPTHLAPLVDVIERMDHEPIRTCSSVATRQGKTTTIGHGIARILKRNPRKEIIYFSFGADFAYKQNREFRRLALEAKVELSKDFSTIKEWRTTDGGGVFACSADQDVIGRGADYVIVDDPIGSPEDADNPEIRENVDKKIRFLTTRVHPGGSVLLNMSRFHPDDPIGRRTGWDQISMPAILDAGTPQERSLWPARWSLVELKRLRNELAVGDPAERTWWAQYMCQPLPDGGNLFNPPARYENVPNWAGYRDALGVDMAFSTSKSADWFALVAVRTYIDTMYVRNVYRVKADMGALESTIRAAWDAYGRCPIFSYMSGPEIGAAHYLQSRHIPVEVMKARFNKLIRSQKTRDRWNACKILLPQNAPWLGGFLQRLAQFRGVDDDPDDELDALVSVHDGMMSSGVTRPMTLGKPRF